MSMAPVSTTSSAQPGGSAGQTVASTGPRVAPIAAAQTGNAVTSGGAGVVATPTTQAGGLAQQISAQALLTLLQTLGKPLSGAVQSGGSSGSLQLQLTMPQLATAQGHGAQGSGTQGAGAPGAGVPTVSGQATTGQATSVQIAGGPAQGAPTTGGQTVAGQASASPAIGNLASVASGTGGQTAPKQISTSLPLPQGANSPAPGTPVQVQAEGAGTAVRIRVTVTGHAPVSPDSLRSDAARQASLAPLMGDVAKLAGQSSASKGIAAAIERLMGFTLDADAPLNAQNLRAAVEGARGGTTISGKPAAPTQSSPTPANMMQSTANAPSAASPDRPSPPTQPLVLSQTLLPISSSGVPAANTMQTAIGALIRALGLAQPDAGAQGKTADGQAVAQPSGKSAPPPQAADMRPSKLPAALLPADTPDMGDPAQMQVLKGKAEAALSRLNLLQAQDLGPTQRGGDSLPALRWDVPLLIGQEAALLGVAIDRDGEHGSEKDGKAQTWRFRFAFESRALGGVEGVVALHQPGDNQHVDVAVWAGEPPVLARLEARRMALVERLQALGVTVDSLTLGSTDDLPEPAAEQLQQHRVDVSS